MPGKISVFRKGLFVISSEDEDTNFAEVNHENAGN